MKRIQQATALIKESKKAAAKAANKATNQQRWTKMATLAKKGQSEIEDTEKQSKSKRALESENAKVEGQVIPISKKPGQTDRRNQNQGSPEQGQRECQNHKESGIKQLAKCKSE